MKKGDMIIENENCTAINLGDLADITEYSLIHPKNGELIEGKVFLKEITGSTGTEISFRILPPKTPVGYYHLHRKNEETYIILRGRGEFQVDKDRFPVREGSVVRISPKGIRTIDNMGDEPMLFMVIQSKENSLEEYTADDGTRVSL